MNIYENNWAIFMQDENMLVYWLSKLTFLARRGSV